MLRFSIVALLLAACGGGEPAVKPTGVDGPGPATPDPGLPKAEGKSGVVFSPDGNALELRVTATGDSMLVDDGTPLELIAEQSGKGFGRADAEVRIAGKVGILPNMNVLVGERMRVSPVSKVGLFVATKACEPDCVSEVWALHPDGRRLLVTSTVTEPVFAFSPDGLQIAVGGKGIWLVVIGTWRVFAYKEFAAPAFSFDNNLYVRSHGISDNVFRLYFGGQAGEIASMPGKPTTAVPDPVTFEDGGKTIVATFARAGGVETQRVKR